jgi:hypothetical protein
MEGYNGPDPDSREEAMRGGRLGWMVTGVVVIVAAGLAAAWWFAQQSLERGIERWVAERRAEGYTIAWRQQRIGGFPFWIEARFEQPSVAQPSAAGGWSWEGESLALMARPWSPNAVTIEGSGRQILGMAGFSEPVRLTGDGFRAVLQLESGLPRQGAVIVVAPALWTETERPDASARRLDLAIDKWPRGTADEKTESAAGRLKLGELALTPKLADRLPFREPIDLGVSASLFGSLPPGPPAQALAAWRDAGGIVEIGQLDLNWGPLAMSGNGTVALDEKMRPLGAGTAVIHGWEAALDRLVQTGHVQARQASIARVVLTALSKPSPAGTEVTVPLTAQDGRLSVGPVPIMPLAPVLR